MIGRKKDTIQIIIIQKQIAFQVILVQINHLI